MVMPNRHDGASSPEWWDDLPPEVRRRVSRPVSVATPDSSPDRGVDHAEQDRPTYRPAVVADLSRLALLFLVIVLANVLFLLIALSFLGNRGSTAGT
jgi:hypothetical protein